MDITPPKNTHERLPGNYGGETLREYCGLSKFRDPRYDTGITAQRLYAAIRRHAQGAK